MIFDDSAQQVVCWEARAQHGGLKGQNIQAQGNGLGDSQFRQPWVSTPQKIHGLKGQNKRKEEFKSHRNCYVLSGRQPNGPVNPGRLLFAKANGV